MKPHAKTMLATALAFLLSGGSLFAQNITVSGVVRDEAGQALIGAGVLTQDGKKGVVTDLNGRYSISLSEADKILRFSYIGYTTQDVVVGGRKTIDVNLVPDATTTLNDAVVIGYGTTKKKDLTGSVVTVKMADIETAPNVSVDQALQGHLAGVDVMSTSGEPGASTSIRIRGTRSIEASNEPLIVVDGVMDAVSDMNEINPSDIESISILKDASSTAIYGSRGANGVVMITTRKGVTLKPRITARATFGISRISKYLDLMNKDELVAYRNDYRYLESMNAEGINTSTPAYDAGNYAHDTNWLKEVTRIAFTRTGNLSMSGKSKSTSYFASLGINATDGVIKGTGFNRITGRFNLTHDLAKWVSVGFKANYTYAREHPNVITIGAGHPYTGAIYLPPYLGPRDAVNPLYENGAPINTPVNSSKLIEHIKVRQNANFVGELTLKPARGWTFKSQNSYTPRQTHVYKYQPSSLPARLEGQGGRADRTEYDALKLMSENTLTWKKRFSGGHSADALFGYSASTETVNTLSIVADGILDDKLKWYNLNAINSKENYTNTSDSYDIVRHSFFARANYSFKNRYYLTATARYDGSSNFAANHKWGFFPSGAFKWTVTREPWMKRVRWMDNLSLRLSLGLSGNDAISAYRSLGVYNTNTNSIFAGTQSAAFYPTRIANPDLTWEKTMAFNAGVDFSVLKERIQVTFDGYYTRTNDLLLTLATVQSTGFSSRYTNLGQTSNRGVELTVQTRNIQKKKFGWTTDFTISHNKQMVDDIGQEKYVAALSAGGYMMYGYRKGYPLNSLWGFQYAGVFKNVEEVQRNTVTHSYASQVTLAGTRYETLLGRARYIDRDHDGVLSMNDQTYLGTSDPTLYGGLQNTFTYKGLRVGVYFSYSLGGKIYNYSELYMSGSYTTNQYRYMLNAWHPVRNPDSDLPRAGGSGLHAPSSFQVHDASYLRLKTLSVSYRFDLTKTKVPLRDITLGVNADNLFLLSRYNGFDPDVSTSSDTSTLRRVDMGAYPSSRMIVFSLQVRY